MVSLLRMLSDGLGEAERNQCGLMRQTLGALDKHGSGYVPLGAFYTGVYDVFNFTETVDYLRSIGALDESTTRHPRVRIANYVIGPSNCFADSPYFSMCCANECDAVMRDVERSVGASMASPEHILSVVGNLSTYSVNAPRQLSPDLVQKAHAIAARHGGRVPLHGRLFAQWLHLAFPHDCPWPHLFEDPAALSMRHWATRDSIASAEERAAYVDEHAAGVGGRPRARLGKVEAMEIPGPTWSEEEVLPLQVPEEPARFAFQRVLAQAALA